MFDNLIDLFRGNRLDSLELVIFGFFLGAVLAAIATVYHRRTIGRLVRWLLEHNATSPENARSLREAEEDLNIFVRSSVRHNAAFRRIVAEREPAEGEARKALSDAPLYIRPESVERAAAMYSAKTAEDANLWMVLLAVVVFGIVAYVSVTVIPALVNYAKGIFG